MVIGDMLRSNARRIPEREALVHADRRVTWGDLDRAANRLANGLLQAGVEPGDRVAVMLPNGIEIVELYFAIAKLGCTSVPIMPRSVAREIAHIVNDVEATAIIAAAEQVPAVQGAAPQCPSLRLTIGCGAEHGLDHDLEAIRGQGGEGDPAITVDPEAIYSVQFTSGTTGAPKGCMLPHGRKVLSRMSMLTLVPYTEQDRALLFMPLTASLGADMLLAHVLAGAATVLMSRFDEAELLRLIEAERITAAYAMESTFDRLLQHEALDQVDWAGLKWFMATSATRDLRPGMARLGGLKNFGARVWCAYGSSEGGGWLTFLSAAEIEAGDRHRSVGRECPLAEVDCVDSDGRPVPTGEVGEMVLSAPWIFSGYWGLPERTAEALREGRYFTGDLARKDEDGYVFLEGRIKDMIKTGGVSVYPAEIESVLREHPTVGEVAVVGVADPEWGEMVVACVVAAGDADEGELIAYCKEELAGFKVPKRISFVEDMPRDPVGKILKRELREQLQVAG